MNKNVHIVTAYSFVEMEALLNGFFDNGYSLSGGLTVTETGIYAVVTKPF